MLYALLPPTGRVSPPEQVRGKERDDEPGGIQRCAPRQIRGGLEQFLDGGGELRLFFPGCLPLAAPFVLFRLKRQGFSGCYVRSSGQGLYVAGRR